MEFRTTLYTDVGIRRKNNQDSLCVKMAQTNKGNLVMAVMCDGMGGLTDGEVASAAIVKAFSDWFENELPFQLAKKDYEEEVRYCWERLIKTQNQIIGEYGKRNRIRLGSTVTALLIFEDGRYLIGHVGDSRVYRITNHEIEVLTMDQTVVAMEVRQGKLTEEEAKTDPRRNVLLQCIGASRVVEPDFKWGQAVLEECYMLCSDGFRHVVTKEEILHCLMPLRNMEEKIMQKNLVELVELNKERGETDNISAILIKIV